MQVGFSVLNRGEEVEFRTFRPQGSEPSPLVTFARERGVVVALMGRLYYRDDLLARLPAREGRGDASDAALVLRAYRAQGLAGLARLEGDFALVIWDAPLRRLLACRDPMGGYPLFCVRHAGGLALSTSVRPLLALLPRTALNLDYLAELLMLPGSFHNEMGRQACAFEGVQRILPGTTLSATIPGGPVEHHAWWNWVEQVEDPGTGELPELSRRYGELLRTAVRERLRGTVASHFSGGMDSTSVALLARDELAGRGPIHALSLVHYRLPNMIAENAYIETALQGQPGLEAHLLAGDDVLDFDDFADPPRHDEPFPGLQRANVGRVLTASAHEVGAATVLTGYGADDLAEVRPYYLTELLRRGRLWSAWSEVARWARAANCNRWQVLYPYGLANLLPAWARIGLGPLLRGGYAGWRGQTDWTIPPWIRRPFARRHDLRGRALANLRRTYSAHQHTGLSVGVAAVGYLAGDWSRWYHAAPLGIHIAHPFLDPRLLRFGLGLQVRARLAPGRQKPILADAMCDVLPAEIRNRRGKSYSNEVYYLGLSRNLPRLEALVRRAPVDDLDFLDKDSLLHCLRQAALGIARDACSLTRLDLTLTLLRWLCAEREGTPRVDCMEEVVAQNTTKETPNDRNS
jgi:asparagine synthase (glutamine-hydrolysing)